MSRGGVFEMHIEVSLAAAMAKGIERLGVFDEEFNRFTDEAAAELIASLGGALVEDFKQNPKRTFATMVCGFGGGNARPAWPGSLQKNFCRPAQIPCRRGSLRAKLMKNLRKQAQCVSLLPSGGT